MNDPIKIRNLTTGEEYKSLQEAGHKLGYLSALTITEEVRQSNEEFVRRGNRLKLVYDNT